ncbi:MAG TPA: DUF4214 domain-containing protein [Pirellulales bacterium]|nr:DUF4214 domain-containing protein [Pirellulales bacterium]
MYPWLRNLSRSAQQRQPSRKSRRRHPSKLARLQKSFFESLEDRTVLSADISGITLTQTSPAAGAHVVPGELITYLITVPNAAAATTTTNDVNLSDVLPLGETVVGATASQLAPGSSIQVDGAFHEISADLGTIAPGANATLTVTALVNTSAGATLDNAASVWSPQDATFNTDGNPKSSNTLSTAVDAVPASAPNVSVAMSGPSMADLGAQITYTVTLTNSSAANAATNVAFLDRLDPNETFVNATDTAGTQFSFDNATGQITGTVASIGTSSTDIVTIVAASTNAAKATGSVTNTALVSIPSGNASGTSSASLTTAFPADISGITIAQTSPAAPAAVAPGQLITYTITVPNASAAAGSTADVNVTDVLPAGATVVGATAGTLANPIPTNINPGTNTVTADLGTIAPGAQQSLIITALVNAGAGATLDNSATVWSPQDAVFNTSANQKTSNTVSTTVESLPANAANVSVSQTGPAAGAAFDTLTYTVTLTNHSSTGAASNVAFIEQLDPNAMFFSASDTAGTNLTYNSATGQVTGTVANIATSGTDTVTIVVVPNFSAANAGSITNSGFVSIPGGNFGAPASASTTTTVSSPAGPANVALDIGEQADSVKAGGVIEYDTVLINQGANAASNIAFSLRLDPNNQLVSISDPDHTTFTLVNGVVTGTIASIPGMGSDHITIFVIPKPAALAAGTVTDSELIAAPGGNTGSSTDSETTTVEASGAAQANVTVAKSAPQSGTIGTPVTDTITLTNNGSAVSNVALVDLLGANVSNVSATDAAGDTFTFVNGQLAGTIANLPVGATAVTVVYTPTAAGAFDDTALIGVPGGNEGTASATASTNVSATAPANLTISKSGSPSTINVGSTLTYTITISNSGGTAATGAVVSDVMPANLTNVQATDAAGTVTISGNTVIDQLGTVAANTGTETLTITATAAPLPASTTVINSASLNFDGDTTMSNVVTTAIDVLPVSLSISKSGDPATINVGGTVTYTVTISNTGGAAANGAVVTDAVPAGLTNIQATDSAGTITISGNTVTDHLGSVAANDGTETLTITATAAPFSGEMTNVSNTAELTFAGTTTPSDTVVTNIVSTSGTTGIGFLAGMPGDDTPQTFVQNLYRELLGREPDASGAAFWVAYVQQHDNAVGRSQVIAAFMNSQEYADHYITTVYQLILGRTPDAGGLQYWAAKMGAPGTPGQNTGSSDEKAIVAAFFGSDEFYIRSGNTPEGWIDALYHDIFGRAADGSGAAFWAQELTTRGAANRDGIVFDLLTTPEASHDVLDSFYPAVGGSSGTPLSAPGTPAGTGATELAMLTGNGWENLYLEGPYDSSPQGNDVFFSALLGGALWDNVQLQLLETAQYYDNPNQPHTETPF